MRKLFLALIVSIVLAAAPTGAFAGEIYGTITESGGKSIGEGVELSVKCGAASYTGKTDKAGGFQLVVSETGKCTLTVAYKQQAPSIEVASYDDGVQVDLVLEIKDGKYVLRRK